jgi:hypothetical protein
MIFTLILLILLTPFIILAGITLTIQDYTEEEKQEVWKNFYNGFMK